MPIQGGKTCHIVNKNKLFGHIWNSILNEALSAVLYHVHNVKHPHYSAKTTSRTVLAHNKRHMKHTVMSDTVYPGMWHKSNHIAELL